MAAGVLAAVKTGVQKTEVREFVMPGVPVDAGLLDEAIRAVEGEGPDGVIHVTVDPWSLSERT